MRKPETPGQIDSACKPDSGSADDIHMRWAGRQSKWRGRERLSIKLTGNAERLRQISRAGA